MRLKAIIQSLRENGVLSSAIASAKLKLNSTAGIPQGKSDALPDSIDSPSKFQATARKMMEISGGSMESAIPPQAPPSLDDLIAKT